MGELRCCLEAEAPRVDCPDGPTVVQVPRARHGAGHTRAFDDQVAWLATHTSRTAVVELMRVAWRTVGAIVTRVVADARAAADPFDGLARIGIDEISCRRGYRFLTVVVDHDSGRLVGRHRGKERATLEAFFDLLGEERCRAIRRAYLLKEELRLVFHLRGEEAKALLRHGLAWASRCRIPAYVGLAARIRAHLAAIHATLDHGLSNGLVESTNTKIRLLTRIAFGFRSPQALIALALLDRGGYCPPLPGRA